VPINQDHRRFGITLEGTDMGRHSLRIIMVLGALVTLVGGTGIFAVFSDRATGGENTVTSGTRPKSADLRIEPAVLDAAGGFNCDGDVDGSLFENDDTTTAQFTVTDAQPGNSLGDAYVCLKNVGSAVLALSVSAIDVVDVDTDCTGDEAISGDTTCGLDLGSLEPQAGELSPLLTVEADRVECTAAEPPSETPIALDAYSAVSFDGIAPGIVTCFWIRLAYPTPATDVDAQVAQSDTVSWRFAFDGTAQ
jgi:hypothetical protein